ncbi:SMI1/KNR4 family protein [Neobacillus niacini]|uniref:SMI1/KNR4 family protein n=1 Tax=Neobacillus niacini TaxID=86668 RepID=UPI0005F08D4E|nr:SMI1/KNR4 family protein [Neobacillus niacini]
MKIRELMERYENLYSLEGLNDKQINVIETSLEIKLPNDFKQICSFYSGELIGNISIFAFDGNSPNIIDETLSLRDAINLPLNFIVLAEPPASLILMDIEKKPSVLWCDSNDVQRIHNHSFVSSPDYWDTFSDFFLSRTIDDEEEL